MSTATVVCKNHTCPYHTQSNFCSKDFIVLNPFGCCAHWWDPVNPNPRPKMWDYAELRPEDITPNYEAAESLDESADEQQLPQDEKTGLPPELENES